MKQLVILALLALFLTGCAGGPGYFRETEDQTTTAEDGGAAWVTRLRRGRSRSGRRSCRGAVI